MLHLNKGDNNVRGHIGTEMSNKAETVLVITKSAENPVISEVHALHIREKEFKPFAFSVDDEGLPVMVDNYSFDGSVRPKARSSFMDLSIEQHREALSAAFGDRPIKGFENVLQALMASYEAIGFKRGRSVMIKTAAVPDGKPEADRQTGQALLLRCDPDRSLAFRRRMRGRRR